jgi:hypothetical protein
MPHYTFPISSEGYVLDVAIWLGATDQQALQAAGQSLPPTGLRVRALLDTGADLTAVTPHLLQLLGLAPLVSAHTQTVGGKVGVDLYRVSLTNLHPTVGAVPLIVYPEWLVMEFLNAPAQLDVLLGRDFADVCLLILDGPRRYFTLGL